MFCNILYYTIYLIMSNLKDLNKVVSARCREELIRLGIKGVDFVAKTGLSKQTFSAVFNGVTSAPSGFISALCTHYPADVSYIITGIHASSSSDTAADNGENLKAIDLIDYALQKGKYDYDKEQIQNLIKLLTSEFHKTWYIHNKMEYLGELVSSAIQNIESVLDKKEFKSLLELLISVFQQNRYTYVALEIEYLEDLIRIMDREIADKERQIKLIMEKNKGTRE